ncbi:helix-turn-helix domain-containing protein [Zongyangia hominis]|uniref:Helix-turn-helix transcriptional regulator n=1 Tax=Zongyangia hominis TaxID=2763677 RepID=A0A926EBB8_9FIRM|nr:helix-turn-helix transcriptional regulator [Zongyangia hominis]MBC8570658.1 helix-turn-helix transcriptional regulator [Zongyangia hominis]
MKEDKNLIGMRLRQARLSESPKATQKDISARLQVLGIKLTDSSIGKIEAGTRPVTTIQLVALAKVLKVSAAWLLGETDDPKFPGASSPTA